MFKRINISLTKPKLIGQFINDKKRAIIGYLLLLLLIVTIPVLIKSIVNDKMDLEFRLNFESEMISQKLDYQITDFQLSSKDSSGIISIDALNGVSLNETISLGSANNDLLSSKPYIFNFTEKDLEFYFGFILINKFSYQDLTLNDVDFGDKNDLDIILKAIDQVYLNNKFRYEAVKVSSFYLSELVSVLFFILISVLIYGMQRPKLKAQYRFSLAVYSFTIFLFSSLLAQLFGINGLKIIGLIWALINLMNSYKHLILLTTISVKEKDIE